MLESGCHVATFKSRDVPTSRRPRVVTFQRRDVGLTDTEVNNQIRRDISTSRRLNVATLQRRDVSTGSAPHHLKHQWFRIGGHREAYEQGHGIPDQ